MSDADRPEPHIGVAQHDALRPAGRTRRVKKGGEVVGIGGRRRQLLAPFEHRGAFFLPDRRAIARNVALRQSRQPRLAADQQACAAVGEDVGDLGALQQRIDRHVDQAGARRRQRQQAGHPVLGQPARDPLARSKAARSERRRQNRDGIFEPFMVEQALAGEQGRRPAIAPQRKMVERPRRRIGTWRAFVLH
jgi:hypothetical protein